MDERWEWEPSLLEFRGAAGAALRGGAAERRRPAADGAAPRQEMDLALRAIADADEAPVPVAAASSARPTLEQLREFMVHRSAYQLKEADPHTWAIPRLHGGPKAAMVEVQADEYGGGRAERIHAQLFADAMEAVGLDSDLRRLPGPHPGRHASRPST